MFIITVCIEEENEDGNFIGKAVFVQTSEIYNPFNAPSISFFILILSFIFVAFLIILVFMFCKLYVLHNNK